MVRSFEDEKLDGWLAEASEAAVMKKFAGPLGRRGGRRDCAPRLPRGADLLDGDVRSGSP